MFLKINPLDLKVLYLTNNKITDFGGFLDIICDFLTDALIPMSFVYNTYERNRLIWCIILEASYYINNVSLFYLAGILIKHRNIDKFNSLFMPKGH